MTNFGLSSRASQDRKIRHYYRVQTFEKSCHPIDKSTMIGILIKNTHMIEKDVYFYRVTHETHEMYLSEWICST